jgi:MFS transporter, UMF1 family
MKTLAESGKTKRGIIGWMMFDWAAQPFFTVVTTFIFGPYFVAHFVQNPVEGQALWSYGAALSGLIIAILSPILGSIADQTGARKPWILFFGMLQIIGCCALWFAYPGTNPYIPLGFFILATMSAEFSIVFNDSMMPSLISKEKIGLVSNIAWALGYAGGLIVLFFVLFFMAASGTSGKTIIGISPIFGLDTQLFEGDRATGPLAALWYALFIMPMIFFTPDQPKKQQSSFVKIIRKGLKELKETIREVQTRTNLFRFLIARMIYQDGVNGLIVLGAPYAAGLFGWGITQVALFGIILSIAAIVGNIGASFLDMRIGSKKIIIIALFMMILATICIISTTKSGTLFGLLNFANFTSEGLFGSYAEKTYVGYGILIGLALGPVQASSRSFMARSVTKSEAGRYFGLYALSGRATSFVAPFTVASVTYVSGSMRLGMATLILFYGVGLWILWSTPNPVASESQPPAQ